jgi:2-dehydro-3-deoxy-D-gluconate 5-dehydrogenase
MTQELFSLAGRTALVTGGNGGLGWAMALGFRAAGAQVAITGRNPEKNAMAIKELGDPKAVLPLDVRDEEAVAQTITHVCEHFGRLDILVNNAGDRRLGGVTALSRTDWDVLLASHLTGAFLCAKYAAEAMIARGEGGKIINIGSVFSLFGPPGNVGYAAAKTGMLGLTRALAVELSAHNIQVNAILPGWCNTGRGRHFGTPRGEEIRRKTPAGRWGTPDDLIGTAVYLASAASDFVTGVSIPVDGGYAVTERLLYE